MVMLRMRGQGRYLTQDWRDMRCVIGGDAGDDGGNGPMGRMGMACD